MRTTSTDGGASVSLDDSDSVEKITLLLFTETVTCLTPRKTV
jgi:hypothetical protein